MTKSSAVTSRRATADWATALPGFDVWRPLHLLRRIGPVMQGVCLDRSTSGDGYTPTAHVHALTREFPAISLMLPQRLVRSSGQPETILFSRHEDEFQAAVDRLKQQSQLSLGAPPSVEAIVRQYHSASLEAKSAGLPPTVLEMEDSVLIAAAVGRVDLVEEGLQLARELAGIWPKARLPFDWEGSEAWIESLAAKAADRDSLTAVIDGQISHHKLGKIREVGTGE
ncbi:hypothetical protein ACF06X_22900 [Streptomyces sp. NPDC015346]|uniref:hypothetical protein n=1 Tax=Streptomyces sp. NPDC015346 TaxID=3364954 RepID=UPI0036F7D332